METPPVRFRVSIVPTIALTGKAVPQKITFAIVQIGVEAPAYLFEAAVAKENIDCCIALRKLGSVVVEADEDMALRKGAWQARIISVALRLAFPKRNGTTKGTGISV